jgi:hypothetical protein
MKENKNFNMQKTLFLLTLSLFILQASYAQDIIHKKDERIIAAKVLKIDSSTVFYKEYTDLNGPSLELPKSEVDHIVFDYSTKSLQQGKNLSYVRPKNAVSLSLGGSSGLIGLKYDRVLSETPTAFLSGGLGIASILSQTNVNLHLSGNWNFGTGKHYLEMGLGFALALNEFNNTNVGLYRYYVTLPMIGYRLQPFESFFMRANIAGFAMLQDPWGGNLVIPTIGIDLGFSF